MMKLNISILFMTFTVVFLLGCQEQSQQEAPAGITEEIQQPEPNKKAEVQETVLQTNSQVQQKLIFAQNNLDMAQKGILSYSQTVALCRSIIKDYPGTESEQKAREILRQIPEDLREQYHLTDQELGL